jgi:hypothetical protein
MAEEDGRAFFAGILDGERVFVSVRASEYRETLQARQVAEYNCRAIWRENRRSGHFGPWRPDHIALIKDSSGAVAQLAEQRPLKPRVEGSSPSRFTTP